MENFRFRRITDTSMVFDTRNDVLFNNTFKNILKREVPSLAIDQVIIEKNNTTFSNEILAFRIMMIPILSDQLHRFKTLDECNVSEMPKDDPTCGSILNLHVYNNPKINKNEHINVTSYDLIPDFSDDPQPIGQPLIIMPLNPNEEIKLQCIVRKGTGKHNVRYSPVSIAIFQNNTGSWKDEDLKNWQDTDPWPWTFEFETRQTRSPIDVFRDAMRIIAGKNYPCISPIPKPIFASSAMGTSEVRYN